MSKKLEANKFAVVTGASRGIGRGIALALAGEGASLVLTARGDGRVGPNRDDCRAKGVKAFTVAGNVADPELVAAAVRHRAKRIRPARSVGEQRRRVRWRTARRTFARSVGPCHRHESARPVPLHPSRDADHEAAEERADYQRRFDFLASRPPQFGRLLGFEAWHLGAVASHSSRRPAVWHYLLLPEAGQCAVPHRAASTAPQDQEPMMVVEEVAEVALLMATLPPHVEMLDADGIAAGSDVCGTGMRVPGLRTPG